jgi:hypothetical protein
MGNIYGEQTYCRKQQLEKMQKTLLGHFCNFFSQKFVLVKNAEIAVFVTKSTILQLILTNVYIYCIYKFRATWPT